MIWTAITSIIPWEWIGGAVAAIVAVLGVWIAGRRSGAVRRDLNAARATDKRHERITDAETDLGNVHSDADRVRRLDEYAKRHGY